MTESFDDIQINNQMSDWQQSAAFNTYWTYSFMGKASFYSLISPRYYDFMNRWVRHWLYWYDGYVPYFHSQSNGIFSTRLATALCDRTAKKVTGGRIMYKNAGRETSGSDSLNDALKFVSGKWSKDADFGEVVKLAAKYAASAGTAMVKLNKDKKGLWAEALRFDSFIPEVDFRGNVISMTCFLQQYTNMKNKSQDGVMTDTFYVVEERYFGDFDIGEGKCLRNKPLVKYSVKRNSGNVTNGQYLSDNTNESIDFKRLPESVRKSILRDYQTLTFDRPSLLPFADSLGCELVKWTDGISNIPQLPFGESLLANLVAHLMSWDYYFSAFNTDMYLGRGRVLMPKGTTNKNGKNDGNYNSGMDSFMFTKVEYISPEEQKPLPIQFDLRSSSWGEIRNKLLENIAVLTGMNISTIASFLTDNTARTAREVSTEENETAGFIDDKREILEKPLNRIIKQVLRYHGYKDDVVIRWSSAGLTNRQNLTEIINLAKAGGFLSKLKAVQMFNFDDDDEQVQEEYNRIVVDEKESSSFGNQTFDDKNFFGDETV